MITATLFRKDGRFIAYQARGHSGYAPYGQDIVCAGVSILSTTCVNALESQLGVFAEIGTNQEGLLEFELPELEEGQKAGAQLLMGALGQGLADLRDAFPENIRFEIRERRK